jgi:hypothetical protein
LANVDKIPCYRKEGKDKPYVHPNNDTLSLTKKFYEIAIIKTHEFLFENIFVMLG